jgi:hypothetical protein
LAALMAEEQAGEGEDSGDYVAILADVVTALDRKEVGQTDIGTKLDEAIS